MRMVSLALFAAFVVTPFAQGQMGYLDRNTIPRVNVAAGYNLVRLNAPPAISDTSGLNGGFASVGVALRPWLTAAGEITGERGNRISSLGQGLTLTTYTAGPRVTLHYSRLTPFAQATFGVAHGSDSYFPRGTTSSSSATSFAFTLGGGLDVKLSRRFDVRPLEVQYLRTGFPNGSSNFENHFLYGVGVVYKFGSHLWVPNK